MPKGVRSMTSMVLKLLENHRSMVTRGTTFTPLKGRKEERQVEVVG